MAEVGAAGAPRPRKQSVALLAFAALCVSALALAQATLVPAPLRAAIIVRSAGYEHHFMERAGPAVLAVVIGKSGAAAEDGRAMAGVFEKLLRETRIARRNTRVVSIVHESLAKTVNELEGQRAEVVYFANGLEGIVRDVPSRQGGIRRILVCANGGDVGVGCSLGVELLNEKPRLVLNLKHANATGLRFAPEFLKLARIVR